MMLAVCARLDTDKFHEEIRTNGSLRTKGNHGSVRCDQVDHAEQTHSNKAWPYGLALLQRAGATGIGILTEPIQDEGI